MLNSAEEKQLVKLLRKIEPGFYPLDVFWEFQRLTKQTAVEIIPLVKTEEEIKIYMIQRESDDKFWPSLWHTPGCIIRPTDKIETAINRVLEEELNSPQLIIKPTYVDTIAGDSPRGDFLGYLMYTLMKTEPKVKNGRSFALDSIPDNIINLQKDFISHVLEAFKLEYRDSLYKEVGENLPKKLFQSIAS